MNLYTVVVLYPAYATREPGVETYTAHVEAPHPFAALERGASQAQMKQPNEKRGLINDWNALVCFDGHIHPVAWGWQK
jgi:hypothetical protein